MTPKRSFDAVLQSSCLTRPNWIHQAAARDDVIKRCGLVIEQSAAREAAGMLCDELGIGPLDFRDRGVVACGDDGDLLRQCPLRSDTVRFCGSAANYAKGQLQTIPASACFLSSAELR